MKKLLLILSLVFSCAFVRAQATFTVNDTLLFFSGSAQASDFASGYTKFYNVSGDTLPMRWVRIENIPAWWRSSVCTEYYCFSIPDDSASWNILPGDSDLVYIHIHPFGNADTGDVVVRLFDTRNPAQFTDIRFVASALTSVPENTAAAFSFWPSPAGNVVNVQLNAAEGGMFRVYDFAGRIAVSQAAAAGSGNLSLDLSVLPAGVYSMVFLSDAGVVSAVKLVKE
ncbi:MAG: T9SS type A sorting domain-containing protein [Bacteroidia bacterium]